MDSSASARSGADCRCHGDTVAPVNTALSCSGDQARDMAKKSTLMTPDPYHTPG